MGGMTGWLVGWAVLALAGPGEPARLAEAARPGDATRVAVELKAEGTFRPATPPGAPEAKPMALRVATRLEYADRVVAVGGNSVPARSARNVSKATGAIGGEARPTAPELRPEVAALVAIRRGDAGVDVASLGGPLTRGELELVGGPGDPLALPALLPPGPVRVGDRWTVGELAAKNLSGYDALAANTLEATVEAVTADSARVRLLGQIRGVALGGEGTMACDGSFTFDRKAGRVDRLDLRRAETRRPGPVESGLDVRSTLTVTRAGAAAAETGLDDATLAAARADSAPGRDLLLFRSPDGKYSLLHDRDWHLYWDDPRQAVFKRLDRGEMVAQCNIAAGPDAGRGRHQDVAQFRDDLKKALGARFVRFAGQGEVEGVGAGTFRYKATIEGRQGDSGVLWHYYLMASPAGEQLIATFTLGLAQQAQFADADLRMMGTLEWK